MSDLDRAARARAAGGGTTSAIAAVWRPNARNDWRDVEIVGEHPDTGQLVLREVGPFWPGVWLAPRETVRLSGREFHLGGARR